MTITELDNSKVFSGDLLEVTKTYAEGSVPDRVAVYVNLDQMFLGDNFIEELYYPIANSISIKDLGKALIQHIEPGTISLTEKVYPTILKLLLTYIEYTGSTDHPDGSRFALHYSTSRTGLQSAAELYNKFLTRYFEKDTYASCIELIGYFLTSGSRLTIGTAYLKAGKECYSETISTAAADPTGAKVTPVNFGALLTSLAADRILFVDCKITDSGGVITDEIRFNILEEEPLDLVTFVYRNTFGVPESICFTGVSTETYNPQSEFASNGWRSIKITDDPLETRKINTGELNSGKIDSVKDMLHSYDIYLYANGELGERYTVIEWSAERTLPSNVISSYALTIRKEQNMHSEFYREYVSPDPIFDASFSNTFE